MSNQGQLDAAMAAIEGFIEQWQSSVLSKAVPIMEDIAEEGAADMRMVIETSVTNTGRARAAAGGHPGRIESGTMHEEIDHQVTVGDKQIVAKWGWLNPELYFGAQEHGLPPNGRHPGIEPMESLNTSLTLAEDTAKARLKGLG